MRFFKKFIIILLSLILLAILFIFIYTKNQEPTYKGNLKLSNLTNPVEVYYDKIGVPHIYADNQKDAYVTLGYVHAQDRLWQMELLSRIASGKLAEIFGKDFVKVDKFFLALGIDEKAKETVKKLDKTSSSYILTQAYLDGVNQYIDNNSIPIEYRAIGFKPRHFTVEDVYNVFGYMSFSFAMAQKTDPLLSNIRKKLGDKYLNELGIKVDTSSTLIPNFNPETDVKSDFVANTYEIMEKLPVSPFIGSNSWVVGGEKTASGKVLFANDPHIEYKQPAVWYQNHIVCPNFEIYGFNLGLIPFPLLGHNKTYAYGLTMFENDDIDFYKETLNPDNINEYLVGDIYNTFETTEYKIKVKGETSQSFLVKKGIHGPIMNGYAEQIEQTEPIAMDWIYTKLDNKLLKATYELSHANNLVDFKEGVKKIHAPGLNIMYGDVHDNIAWFAAGKLYKHLNNVNTKLILNGSNNKDDQLEYLDFSKNPQAINPTWNYVYSANNQPDQIEEGFYYPGYYLPEDRAKRIVDVLQDKTNLEVADMKRLINDVTSSILPELIPLITKEIDEDKLSKNELYALKVLRNWDASFELNQVAPTIFYKFKYQFYKNTFQDELGEKGFEQFLKTHIIKKQFAKLIKGDNSIWFDNIKSLDLVEDKKYIITQSFKETVKFLETQQGKNIRDWQWKKVNTVEHEHVLGKVKFLRKYFNVGPFPVRGGNEVLNNKIADLNDNGIYKVKAGPSTRRIIDFNDIENSIAILPTGQSGNVFSKHYKDQAESYIHGKFYTMYLNKDIIQKFEDKLTITPKK